MPKVYGTPGPRLMQPSMSMSSSLARCSLQAQLLFDRLVLSADDQGRQLADPEVVKAACFPRMPQVKARDIRAWLAELARADLGMIVIYEDAGEPILQLLNWWDSQQGTRRAYASRWTPPPGWEDKVRDAPAASPHSARNLPAACPLDPPFAGAGTSTHTRTPTDTDTDTAPPTAPDPSGERVETGEWATLLKGCEKLMGRTLSGKEIQAAERLMVEAPRMTAEAALKQMDNYREWRASEGKDPARTLDLYLAAVVRQDHYLTDQGVLRPRVAIQ